MTPTRPPTTKADIERMCRRAGMTPAERTTYKGREIFVADGFSSVPQHHYKRFGVDPEDFPKGAYCTLWFVGKGEDKLDVGLPLLFKADHNPGMTSATRRTGRINRALTDARAFIDQRELVRLHA